MSAHEAVFAICIYIVLNVNMEFKCYFLGPRTIFMDADVPSDYDARGYKPPDPLGAKECAAT